MAQASKQLALVALNDALTTSTLLTGTLCVQVTGTFSATFVFEATVDGSTWFAVNGTPPASSTSVTSVTGIGQWLVQVSGYSQFRTRCSVYVSGGAVVSHGSGEVSQPVPSTTGSGGGGGGAVTIADGADVRGGAIADPAVAAGAAGTDSAKLRRLTTDLSAALTALQAAIPAGTNLIGKVGIDQSTPGTTNAVSSTGNVAAAAADSGNPVKMGGKYNVTLPTLADGNRGDAQLDSRSQQLVAMGTTLDETNDKIRAVSEGYKTSYSTTAIGLAPAVTATDIFEIKGSATKTVRITRITVTGIATAAGAYLFQLIKRSAANTVGTSTAPTPVPHDSSDAAATATFKAYTANPTLGTAVGTIRAITGTVSTGAGAIPIVAIVFEFGRHNDRACVLRGVAESLCLNLNGVTMTGGSLSVECTHTEE